MPSEKSSSSTAKKEVGANMKSREKKRKSTISKKKTGKNDRTAEKRLYYLTIKDSKRADYLKMTSDRRRHNR
jgi:hypothetical protein